jgi:hypothetical protein
VSVFIGILIGCGVSIATSFIFFRHLTVRLKPTSEKVLFWDDKAMKIEEVHSIIRNSSGEIVSVITQEGRR